MNSLKKSSRILSFDSVRGLASLSVVLCHGITSMFPRHNLFELTPFYLIEAGHEAVVFFFLLSGFVLVKHCFRETIFNYWDFITKRVCRLYLPYFSAMVLAFLLFSAFAGRVPFTETNWLNEWTTPISRNVIIANLILIKNSNFGSFNPVIWSLIHEMRISIIFPILLFVLKYSWQKVITIALTLSLIAGILIVLNINPSASYNSSYVYTIHYFALFLIGGLLVKYEIPLSAWYNGITHKTRVTFLCTALFIYCYARMAALVPHKFNFFKVALFNELVADWLVAIAVAYIMVACLNISKKDHVLQSPVPLFLGKISYSLYLIHVPIMISMYNLMPGISILIVIPCSIVLSIIIGFIFNKFIEQPSAKLGKVLTYHYKTNIKSV